MSRFVPRKRTAVDGRTWWCVWDTLRRGWSTYVCHFAKFRTRLAAQAHIDYYAKAWNL